MCRCRPAYSALFAVLVSFGALAACRRATPHGTPVATASLHISRDKAPIGSPIDLAYKFVVAGDAHFDQDYRVMVHVVDADNVLMWTDDHVPPTPTSQWKPGQTIEYTRTVFIPAFPYVGEATLQLGLYSPSSGKRLTLAGEDAGQQAYKVATLQLQPQSDNLPTVFKSGWHPAESVEHNSNVTWQWTKKVATLVVKNPHKASVLFLELDNPGGVFNEPQQVRVTIGDAVLADIAVTPQHLELHRIPIAAAQFGTADMADIQFAVDKTFVPIDITGGTSKDPRELGVRVFHAFVEPAP
jgi:hypothetical protein